jgi:RimJ/RimL family protein N-acetyltransferase
MFHVTERLLLRPPWPEDADDLFGGVADEIVVRNLARAPWPYLPEHAHAFVSREQDQRVPNFLMTLPEKDGSRIIGSIGFGQTDTGIELGYWIARPYWGKGYATEAGRGLIEVAKLLRYTHLEAGHFLDNPASGRVLRKLGFQPTGKVAKRHSCGRGGKADCMLYRLELDAEGMSAPQAA